MKSESTVDRILAAWATDGDAGRAMCAADWAATPLGSVASWPASLTSLASSVLDQSTPAALLWGPQFTVIHNDAFAKAIRRAVPAVGQPVAIVLEGLSVTAELLLRRVFETGQPPSFDAHELRVSASPARDDEGNIAGVMLTLVPCEQSSTTAPKDIQQLNEVQRRLADAVTHAPAFIAILRGPEHTFEVANSRYCELVGNRELIGRTVAEALPDGVGQGFIQLLDEVYRTGQTRHRSEVPVELKRQGRGPETVILNFVCQPLRDTDGSVRGILVHGFDVSSLVRARESLRESEQTHRTLIDQSAAGIAETTLDGRILHPNQRLCDLLGYTAEELIGRTVQDLTAPDDRDEAARLLQRGAATGVEYAVEKRYVRKDGQIVWAHVSAGITKDASGMPKSIIGVVVDITARKEAERVHRENEARFQQLADALPQIVWVSRPDGADEYYNRRWTEYVGLCVEPEGQSLWLSAVHPDDRKIAEERWNAALATGLGFESECRFRRHDGEYRWFLARSHPLRDGEGAIIRWFGTSTDIHDQKLTEATIRFSQQQTEIVVKGANVGVWYRLYPFDKPIWDDKVKEHFHLAPDAEVTVDTFYERVHPDDRQRTRRAIENSIATQQPYDIDYRTVSPDGTSTKWIRASGRGFRDAAGNPTRFEGITIDVTDRVLAELRVREETNTVETINRVGRSVAAELDLSKLVQEVTDATTQLTGAQVGAFFYNVINDRGESYSLSTLSGAPRSYFEGFPMPRNTDLFAPTFAGTGIVRLDDVTADPRYGRSEPFHGMPKGHFPVRSYLAAPVVSRSGEVLGGLFFGHCDVGVFTERAEKIVSGIAAQAAVAIDNARLFESARRANAEKDRLLASERAAREEVERASRMKDEFLATLSHELRTPLNAILGWSQILIGGAQNADDLAEGLRVIERNARSQTQIIEDLLDMSRIISGKVRLDVQRVNMVDVVRGAIETVKPAAEARGIRLQSVLDPVAGPVSGDPNRLQQVLWNLLSNAIKFTAREGRVQVVLERVNSHLEVSVIDTGEGIAPEFLPHVFDRFRQADASTTRKHGGLGLGLAIVKQLVELHGGSVRVKSGGAGQGSTFTVTLPLTVIHPEPAGDVERRHPQSADGSPNISDLSARIAGVKVLVVDDEPDARVLVCRLLEDCKAVVSVAGSGAEAMNLLLQDLPDIVISDIGMPGEDGYALIRKIRALPTAKGGAVPAVALTAYARAEDRVRSILAGFQAHIAKPVEPAELIAIIASFAGRTH